MKKMFKKAVAIVLTAAMAMTATVPAFAGEANDTNVASNSVITHAHDVEYKREIDLQVIQWERDILVPGQDPEGEVYPPGSSISYTKTGGAPVAVSFTFGGSHASVSLEIDPRQTVASGTANSREIGVNTLNPCLLFVDQKIRATRYAVYERLIGSDLPWNFVEYQYGTEVLQTEYHIDEV